MINAKAPCARSGVTCYFSELDGCAVPRLVSPQACCCSFPFFLYTARNIQMPPACVARNSPDFPTIAPNNSWASRRPPHALMSNFFPADKLIFVLSRSVNWRRPSNLDAAFAASASATGLDSVPLAETFRYEVDPTCGGVLGAKSSRGVLSSAEEPSRLADASASFSSSPSKEEEELYSPVALSFVSPVLEVKWPVGVLLPTGVLHAYGSIHRSLFRHQLTLHRLRRLRVALRELDACVDVSSDGGGGDRPTTVGRRRGRGGGGGSGGRSGGRQRAGVSWDRGRLHWLHLFRHEMQHMADSLQVREPRGTGMRASSERTRGLIGVLPAQSLLSRRFLPPLTHFNSRIFAMSRSSFTRLAMPAYFETLDCSRTAVVFR